MDRRKEIALWLEKIFLEWQTQSGERKTQGDFAIYLEVDQSMLSRWINGQRLPTNENVIKLGNKLGPEIYDLLGWVRPECK